MVILGYIIVSLLSSLLTYLVFKHKVELDYSAYDERLEALAENVGRENAKTEAALQMFKFMNDTVKRNRDELDVLMPEFKALKSWSYEHVKYLPSRKKMQDNDDSN